jgi:hypothetical protein
MSIEESSTPIAITGKESKSADLSPELQEYQKYADKIKAVESPQYEPPPKAVSFDRKGQPISDEPEIIPEAPKIKKKEEIKTSSQPEEDYSQYYEEEAKLHGWKPRNEYHGPKGRWVDAKTYIERETLFKRQKEDRKKLDELNNVLQMVLKTSKSAEERAYAQAKADLEHERQVARSTGDFNRYENVIKKTEALDKQYQSQANPNTNKTFFDTDDFKSWHKEENWFHGTSPIENAMTKYAVELSNEYAAKNPYTADPKTELEYISKGVRDAFPTYKGFVKAEDSEEEEDIPAPKVSASRGGNRASSPSKSNKSSGVTLEQRLDRLPAEHKMVVEYLKRNNQDYMTHLNNLEKNLK